jgi:hypothetical protein
MTRAAREIPAKLSISTMIQFDARRGSVKQLVESEQKERFILSLFIDLLRNERNPSKLLREALSWVDRSHLEKLKNRTLITPERIYK